MSHAKSNSRRERILASGPTEARLADKWKRPPKLAKRTRTPTALRATFVDSPGFPVCPVRSSFIWPSFSSYGGPTPPIPGKQPSWERLCELKANPPTFGSEYGYNHLRQHEDKGEQLKGETLNHENRTPDHPGIFDSL